MSAKWNRTFSFGVSNTAYGSLQWLELEIWIFGSPLLPFYMQIDLHFFPSQPPYVTFLRDTRVSSQGT